MLMTVLRSILLSGVLTDYSPVIMGLHGIWIALPVLEVMAAVLVCWYTVKKVNS